MEQNTNTPKKSSIKIKPWWIIVGVVVIIAIAFISMYNGLAKENQTVEAAWGQVENQLQRRNDLVPNLVNSVKGSMSQEQKVFEAIAEARKSYGNAKTDAEKMTAANEVQSSVGTLVNVIREDYPTLNSNKNVQTLMDQLEGTENRIATERGRYNEAVETYNKSVVSFPKNIFANMMGLGKKTYFKAASGSETAPTVNFDSSSSSSK